MGRRPSTRRPGAGWAGAVPAEATDGRSRSRSWKSSSRKAPVSSESARSAIWELLDPTNYSKSIEQLFLLLYALGLQVELAVRERSDADPGHHIRTPTGRRRTPVAGGRHGWAEEAAAGAEMRAGPPTGYSVADLAADVEAVLVAEGLGRFHLMTFSRGTTPSIEVARAAPERRPNGPVLVARGTEGGILGEEQIAR